MVTEIRQLQDNELVWDEDMEGGTFLDVFIENAHEYYDVVVIDFKSDKVYCVRKDG